MTRGAAPSTHQWSPLLSHHSSLHSLTRREEKRKREEEKQVKTIEHTRRQSPGMVCVTYTYQVFSLPSATKESLTCQRLYLKSVHAYLISHLLSSQHREQSVVTYRAVDRQADWQMDWRRDRRTDRRTDRGTEKRCSLHAGVFEWQSLCQSVVFYEFLWDADRNCVRVLSVYTCLLVSTCATCVYFTMCIIFWQHCVCVCLSI